MIGRRAFINKTIAGTCAAALPRLVPLGPDEECHGHRFILSDGRALGFTTYGDHSGWPILYFHGIPTSRIEARFYESAAYDYGCQLIAIDRPGFGLSDFQYGRHITDWVCDINEFVNARKVLEPLGINLEQFSILSFSSGAAYALTCAANLPASRLKSIGIVDGVAPLDKIQGCGGVAEIGFRLADRQPRLATTLFNSSKRNIRRRPKRVLKRYSRFYAAEDARVFSDPCLSQILVESYLQCVRCGPRGVVYDMSLLARPWGFDVEQIDQKVNLWYGKRDITTPLKSTGAYLNCALQQSCLFVNPNQGHLSMLDSMAQCVIRQLRFDAGLAI